MIQSIKKSVVMLLLVVAFTSCNQGPTLQTYYVDNELKPGYAQYDAPTSLINLDGVDMTEEQRDAYKSVNKLNILLYTPSDKNKSELQAEIEKVNVILKDPKYEELVRGSTAEGKFVVKYLGDIDNVDELILFGNSKEKGFVIARLLGDDMNAGKIYSLRTVLEKAQFDEANFGKITDFFK
jgi:hypothetical protein